MIDKNSFIYKAHCENNRPSSKRLWGAIGYLTFQVSVLAATILSLYMTTTLSQTIKDLLEVDLITSASLLGISTIVGAFGNGRSVSIGTTTQKTQDSNKDNPDEDSDNTNQ